MSLVSEYAAVPFAGAVHDFSRPLRDRARARKICGPYHMRPREPGGPVGFYLESGRRLAMARHGATMGLRLDIPGPVGRRGATGYHADDHGDSIILPLVARLPHGRGFLAGWTMGPGMCGGLDRDLYADPESAGRAAHNIAETVAESAREIDERERAELERADQIEADALALETARPDLYQHA